MLIDGISRNDKRNEKIRGQMTHSSVNIREIETQFRDGIFYTVRVPNTLVKMMSIYANKNENWQAAPQAHS